MKHKVRNELAFTTVRAFFEATDIVSSEVWVPSFEGTREPDWFMLSLDKLQIYIHSSNELRNYW